MYKIFGWINVAIVIIMISPFILRWLNSHVFKSDKPALAMIVNMLRTLHKILGGLLFASVITHAVLALGAWRWHTGIILGIAAATAAILAIMFYIFKKKWLFLTHRILAGVAILLLLVHLIFPSALYYIFGV